MPGKLYLFPVSLAEGPLETVLPPYNKTCLMPIRHFIVEDVRTARRFLKKNDPAFDIDACSFQPLNKHTSPAEVSTYLEPLLAGHDMGLLSEAGCPAVADPGADVVALAQAKGCTIVPLVGPSSLLLALMGSGFNGQRFAFEGYLPVDKEARIKTIKRLEQRGMTEDMTHLVIETPYRNNVLMADLLTTLSPKTRVCVALDLTGPEASIRTLTVAQWRKTSMELPKLPCLFLFYT